MIKEILRYKEIKKNIHKEIANSPFKTDYIIKQSGINYNTFYRKLRKNTFTSDEILKILFIIKPEEAKKYHFQLLLRRSLEDTKKRNTISTEEMKKHIDEKYKFNDI